MKKEIPVLFSKKENCCGCSACYVTCPVKAIEMKPDQEGFLYPTINAELCICCLKCISVCVFKKDQQEKGLL